MLKWSKIDPHNVRINIQGYLYMPVSILLVLDYQNNNSYKVEGTLEPFPGGCGGAERRIPKEPCAKRVLIAFQAKNRLFKEKQQMRQEFLNEVQAIALCCTICTICTVCTIRAL